MQHLTAIAVLFATGAMFSINPAVAQRCPMMQKHSKDAEEGTHMKSRKHGKMMRKHSEHTKHAKCIQGGKHGKRLKGRAQCKKASGMKRGMAGKKIIPTEDGGVVVQLGHKLIKYDQDMNKVGEAKVQLNEEDIREQINHMQKMRDTCAEIRKEKDEDSE